MDYFMFSDNSRKTVIVFLLTGILLSLLFFKMVIRKAVIDFDLKTESKTTLKVYWAVGEDPYSEENAGKITLTPGNDSYSFRICNIGNIDRLRIDTSDEKISKVTIRKISIHQNGYKSIEFYDKASFEKLVPLRGIEELTYSDKGLRIIPADKDPILEYRLPALTYEPEYIQNAFRVLAIFLVLGLLFWATHILCEQYSYVPYLLFFILALIIVMAGISRYNQHPDEFVHIYAAEYYQNHILPPQVGAPEIQHTYSQYGFSRLDAGEIMYLFAGKFMQLLDPFHIPTYMTLRFFNVLLFSIIFFFALHKPDFRILLLPVLMSSQIWYIFSYFNSDAFGLFITLIVVYQLVAQKSMFNSILIDGFQGRNLFFFIVLAVLFGLMVMMKMNFYFFIVFCFFYIVWKIVFKEIVLTKVFVRRLLTIVFFGLVIVGIVKAGDVYVNGFDKAAKIEKYREESATLIYNPSTPLNKKHAYLQKKDRGETLKSLFTLDHWGGKSFESSFGVYGYTSVLGTFPYYALVKLISGGLLGLVVLSTLFRGGWKGNALLTITLFCSLSLIGAALYRSWTADFQPQGRYLLPIVAMFSVLLFHSRKYFIMSAFNLFFVALFLLSTYSFVFVGLFGIEKYSF
jgi:hypothetical protein